MLISRDADAAGAGVVILLKYPYPREVCEPVQYDCIKVHAQMSQVQLKPDRLRLSVSTSELYTLIIHIVYLWSPYVIGQTIYIFILSFVLSFFFLFFSSPNLSGRRLDDCHASTHGVTLVLI